MIGDLTKQLLDQFVLQVEKAENRQKLHEYFVYPIIRYILEKLWPYLIGCAVICILIILLTLFTITLVIYFYGKQVFVLRMLCYETLRPP